MMPYDYKSIGTDFSLAARSPSPTSEDRMLLSAAEPLRSGVAEQLSQVVPEGPGQQEPYPKVPKAGDSKIKTGSKMLPAI